MKNNSNRGKTNSPLSTPWSNVDFISLSSKHPVICTAYRLKPSNTFSIRFNISLLSSHLPTSVCLALSAKQGIFLTGGWVRNSNFCKCLFTDILRNTISICLPDLHYLFHLLEVDFFSSAYH